MRVPAPAEATPDVAAAPRRALRCARLARLAGLAVLVTLVGAAPALAGSTPRASLAEIEQEVMCPTCGTPLIVADSPLADRERQFIEQRIAHGDSKAQIEREMVAQFGPGILATPRASGFGLSAYLVPIVAGMLALLVVGVALRRWRTRTEDSAAVTSATMSAPLARRLDDDLARYDS